MERTFQTKEICEQRQKVRAYCVVGNKEKIMYGSWKVGGIISLVLKVRKSRIRALLSLIQGQGSAKHASLVMGIC